MPQCSVCQPHGLSEGTGEEAAAVKCHQQPVWAVAVCHHGSPLGRESRVTERNSGFAAAPQDQGTQKEPFGAKATL